MKPKRKTLPIGKSGTLKPQEAKKLSWELQVRDHLREWMLKHPSPKMRSKLEQLSPLKSFGPSGQFGPSGRREPKNLFDGGPAHYLGEPLGSPRSGGVMTDNIVKIPGRRVIESGAFAFGETTVTTTVQAVTSYQKILSNVASVSGDHKAPNPHQFKTHRITYGNGFTWAGDNRNWTRITGDQAVGFALSPTGTDAKAFVYNKCLSKMYEKIRGDVDLSVDAFQARQSTAMMSQRFKQARDVFTKQAPHAIAEMITIANRLRRSNPRDWGSLWLEWTYGWKPLAGSVFGAAQGMVSACSPPGSGISAMPVRENASEKGTHQFTRTVDSESVIRTRAEDSVYQCRIVAFYAMTTGGLNSVAGLTSLNPVSIAWELVPYSFVADWFVDVGSYLRNMESSLLYGSDFVGGYLNERSKITVVETANGGDIDFAAQASGEVEIKEFKRSVLGSSPMPRPPSFNAQLGVSRLISAASLLSQQLHSLKHVKARKEKRDRGNNEANWNLFPHG